MNSPDFVISWRAPIIPSYALAGIPIGVCRDKFESAISRYLVGDHGSIYKFDGAPILRLEIYDKFSDRTYFHFYVHDDAVVNELKRGLPALTVMFRAGVVFAVKVYDFSFPGDLAEGLVYSGVLPGGCRLGSPVSSFLEFTSLEFDEAEEWFYADADYGGLEITGWGVPLEDEPDQTISAICVIP